MTARQARASLRKRPGAPGWLAAAVCLTGLLAACANVPDSGTVQRGLVAANQPQNYLQPIPVPPKPWWTAEQVVNGFLAASASYRNDPAAARAYLTPDAARSWHPGWAVTVVSPGLRAISGPKEGLQQVGQYAYNVQVEAAGQKLAFLTDNGQYTNVKGGFGSTYQFNVTYVPGLGWRISKPLPHFLMLTQADFQRVYQPRNLYFLAPGGQALVPYPVFVPLQATSVDLATQLVKALLEDPRGWLDGAAQTAVPARSWQIRPVTISGGVATVDLGGAAAAATGPVLHQIADQLVWTLAGPSGGQTPIQSVQLQVNGRYTASASLSAGQPPSAGRGQPSVPEPPAGIPAYSIAPGGAVQKLSPDFQAGQRVPGQAGEDGASLPGQPLTTIAVSPDRDYLAGLTAQGRVYFGPLTAGARLARWGDQSGFTSLSWDNQDNLWIAGPEGVWMQPGAGGAPLSLIAVPFQVRQLRVAPDGVRVAMIVVTGSGAVQLRLGAIARPGNQPTLVDPTVVIGSGVTDPTKLTWYDADNLIVLSGSKLGLQLQEVPVNGNPPSPVRPYPGARTLTISGAGPGRPLLAGLPGGRLGIAANINGAWGTVKDTGPDPVYPG